MESFRFYSEAPNSCSVIGVPEVRLLTVLIPVECFALYVLDFQHHITCISETWVGDEMLDFALLEG